MNQRYILSILCALIMLYYAIPRLSFESVGLPKYFSIIWLLFALMAIGGNLGALLYSERKQKVVVDLSKNEHKRMRRYDA